MDALRKHKHELQKSLPPTPASLEVRKRKGLVNEDEADWVPNPKRKSKGKGKAKARAIQRTPGHGGKKAQRAGQASRKAKAASLLAAFHAVVKSPETAPKASQGQTAPAEPVGGQETPIRPIELPLQGATGGESSAMGSSHGESISVLFPRFPVNRPDEEEGKRGNEDGTKGEDED